MLAMRHFRWRFGESYDGGRRRRRRLELQLSAVPALTMDASQFEQVVLNLVVNARDAIETTGAVTINATTENVARARAVASNLTVGTYVRLAVGDTGCGIPADVFPRIFDPFVTTKVARGGTGLGLATVQRMARENGGDVFMESQVGVGTTIEVWLSVAALAKARDVRSRDIHQAAFSAESAWQSFWEHCWALIRAAVR